MYLENIIIENVGPIEKLNIECSFLNNGDPKPIIVVGENGSGKSIFVSNIVDSLYEFAKQPYRDIVSSTFLNQSPYFKIIATSSLTVGKNYGFSFLRFKSKENDKRYEYVEKIGDISFENCKEKTDNLLSINNGWQERGNVKSITHSKDDYEKIFQISSMCYFPPYRYEMPHWLNSKSLKQEKFSMKNRFSGILQKPILIQNVLEENKAWLLDIILDSRVDINRKNDGSYEPVQNLKTTEFLRDARRNIEEILSQILCQEVELNVNYRNQLNSRFGIRDSKSKEVIIPTLDNLSTGQVALFNIFSTIVKYSDIIDIRKGVKLSQIEGIVIIDEIDLHLHSVLLKEVVPNLIKLFPKVQFFITSHSPLFLLGLEESLGREDFCIYEMPNGRKISTERFSQFQESFQYYKETSVFEKELKNKIDETNKPLVITEGKTDVTLINAAWEKLYPDKNMPFECMASGIEIEKRQGSADSVRRTLEFLANITSRKIIGLFDNDKEGNEKFKGLNKKVFEEYKIDNSVRKHKVKDIWGLLLPVPCSRRLFVTDNNITQRYLVIEHYFSDEILKNHNMYGDNILGTDVFKINNKKNDFSKEIKQYEKDDFENFILLFDQIQDLFECI